MRSRSARTWSTAPTRPSPRPARSGSSSLGSEPPRLILASRSPQRRAILEQLGLSFEVIVPEVEELTDGDPETVVSDNASLKAVAVAGSGPQATTGGEALVIAADTVVAVDGRIHGKPADRDEAEAVLRLLAGREHQVLTGVVVNRTGGAARSRVAITDVRFRPLDEDLLAWYLDSGEWQGRAGGYAIQGRGAALVEAVYGDYLNVVGLPVATLLELEPRLLARR